MSTHPASRSRVWSTLVLAMLAAFAATCALATAATAQPANLQMNAWNTCVVDDGAGKCWGGLYGLNANFPGFPVRSTVPTTVPGLESGVTEVAPGQGYACAIISGGAYCWGGLNAVTAATVTPGSNTPSPVSGLSSGVTDLALNGEYACVVVDGAVKCWGNASSLFTLFGQLPTYAAPTQVPGLTEGATKVTIGYGHACALVGDAVKCWGNNWYGQRGTGQGFHTTGSPDPATAVPSGATDVSAFQYNTCAVVSGAGQCWGWRTGLLRPTLPPQVPAPDNDAQRVPSPIVGWESGLTSISAGTPYCAVISGAASCWGDNTYGQLGDGTTTNRVTPAVVPGLDSGVTEVASFRVAVCAATGDDVKCLGANQRGWLGDGTATDRHSPVTALLDGPPTPLPVVDLIEPQQGGTYQAGGIPFAVNVVSATAGTSECRTEQGALADCADLYWLAPGEHDLVVRHTDALGLVAESHRVHFTVEGGPPLEIVAPSGVVEAGGIDLDLSGLAVTPGAVFTCYFDGGLWFDCADGDTLPALSDGPHTLNIFGTNGIGAYVWDDSSFTVESGSADTEPPTLSLSSPVAGDTNDASPTLQFTASDNLDPSVSVRCRLSDTTGPGPDFPCADGDELPARGDGTTHTLTVYATDDAGNEATASVTYTIDLTPPNVDITSPTNGAALSTGTPTISFTATDAHLAEVKCTFDGGLYSNCTSPFVPSALTDGSHSVTVRATDSTGHATTVTSFFSVTILTPTSPPPLPPAPSTITPTPLPGGGEATVTTAPDAQGNTTYTIPKSEAALFPGGEFPLTVVFSIPAGSGTVSGVRLRWVPQFGAAPPRDAAATTAPLGQWTATLNIPSSGNLFLIYTLSEGSVSQQFIVPYGGVTLIDPQGIIYDKSAYTTLVAAGATAAQAMQASALTGATVTLQRQAGSAWNTVLSGDPGISPHINPQTTGANGKFQWDVSAGTYRVQVARTGYTSATSGSFVIPPPKLDANIGLTPTSAGPPSGTVDCNTLTGTKLTLCKAIDNLSAQLIAKICGPSNKLWYQICKPLITKITNINKALLARK